MKRQENFDLINSAKSDILDPAYARYAAQTALCQLAPTAKVPENLIFQAIDAGEDGFMLHSNIDIKAMDVEYRKVPGQEDGSLTEELLANYIFNARVDAYFASSYMSGYLSDGISSALMKNRFLDLIRRRDRDVEEIDLFQEHIFQNGRKLREAINMAEVSFDDALNLVAKAKKFQSWLGGLNPDQDLISQYLEKISEDSWLGRLPGKVLRWVTTGGLGVAASAMLPPAEGALIGLGFGAVDTFFLDRIIKGWRPDQFVRGPLENIIVSK